MNTVSTVSATSDKPYLHVSFDVSSTSTPTMTHFIGGEGWICWRRAFRLMSPVTPSLGTLSTSLRIRDQCSTTTSACLAVVDAFQGLAVKGPCMSTSFPASTTAFNFSTRFKSPETEMKTGSRDGNSRPRAHMAEKTGASQFRTNSALLGGGHVQSPRAIVDSALAGSFTSCRLPVPVPS